MFQGVLTPRVLLPLLGLSLTFNAYWLWDSVAKGAAGGPVTLERVELVERSTVADGTVVACTPCQAAAVATVAGELPGPVPAPGPAAGMSAVTVAPALDGPSKSLEELVSWYVEGNKPAPGYFINPFAPPAEPADQK